MAPMPLWRCWPTRGEWVCAPFECSPCPALTLLTPPILLIYLDRRRRYDMEDAMILNKSSVERGFAHAYLYKTEAVDLREERGK